MDIKLFKRYSKLYTSYTLDEIHIPPIILLVSLVLSLMVFSLVIWASFTHVNEVVAAEGELLPEGNIFKVQHMDGGIIENVYVREGDVVEKGQLLLSLDPAGIAQDLATRKIRQVHLLLKAHRLLAFVENTKPDFKQFTQSEALIEKQLELYNTMVESRDKQRTVIQRQIDQHNETLNSLNSKLVFLHRDLKLANQVNNMYQSLGDKGHSSQLKLLEEKRRILSLQRTIDEVNHQILLSQKSVKEYETRLSSLDATTADKTYKDLEAIENEIAENKESIDKLTAKFNNLSIRASVEGIIKSALTETAGSILAPRQVLFEIVPTSKSLVATIRIHPKDISQIHVGQKVNVKISSFDYIQYGTIPGEVTHLSASSFRTDNQLPYYKAFVKLSRNYFTMQHNKQFLMPGMLVSSEVITGKRTIMSYLLNPFYRSFHSAFTK